MLPNIFVTDKKPSQNILSSKRYNKKSYSACLVLSLLFDLSPSWSFPHCYDLPTNKLLWSLHEITVITSHYRTVLISPRTHCCDLLIIILFWSSHEPTIMIRRHDHTVMISSWRISRIVELHMHCAEDSVNYFKTYRKIWIFIFKVSGPFHKIKIVESIFTWIFMYILVHALWLVKFF
jgi:hypothetical protein